MNNQAIEFELIDSMKSLNINQKDDVLNFVKKISERNLGRRKNRKSALKEIRAALRKSIF
ncbi:MAG: hypothetical protein ACJA2S_000147 [Cyclobacteriaceae bacterium]|jgi:hypothetical protein